MKHFFLFFTISLCSNLIFTQVNTCNVNLFENFEGYPYGSLFVSETRKSGDNCWTTWDCINVNNNVQDVKVLTNSSSGNYINLYSLNSNGGPDDIVRYLGNKTAGRYELTFDIRVRSGKCALYSLLHNFICNDPNNSDYAFTTRFYNGYIQVKLGQNNYYSNLTSYNSNTWFSVKHIIDLDKKTINFYPNSNSNYYYQWQFDVSNKINRNNSLGAINFWAHSNADYDIDNIKLTSYSNQSEFFNVSFPGKNFPNGCNPSTFCFEIVSNSNWSINSPSWLNLAPISGNGNSTICGSISSNPSTSNRTATINFTYGINNNNQGIPMVITQEGCGQPMYCFFDPPSLSFSCSEGVKNANILSNDNWNILSKPSWVQIKNTDLQGSGAKNIEFTINKNSGIARTGTIVYNCGSGSASLYISQDACSTNCNFAISPNPINVEANGVIDTQLLLNSSSLWYLIDNELGTEPSSNLFGGNPVNDRKGTLTIKPNSSFQPRLLKLKFGYCQGQEYELIINQKGNKISNNSPWVINKTALIHTVVLEKNLQSDISGLPISPGDWIGLFYKDDTISCAGAGQWLGGDLPILVYGDDPISLNQDGFKKGQKFIVKIRKYNTTNNINSKAEYYQPNGNPWTASDMFTDGGLSGIYFIKADNCLKLPVYYGNTLVSSYVKPIDLNMLNIFNQSSTSIRTIVDDNGQITMPWNSFNSIGDWNFKKAYKISAAYESFILDVFCGDKIIPENEKISIIDTQVAFIPYLRDNARTVDAELSKYKDKILWLKDENLNTIYLPQANLVWGDLEPLKGYILKARSSFDLIYSPNFKNNETQVRNTDNYFFGDYFKTDFKFTTNGTLLVIPEELAKSYFNLNDEIAVFKKNELICGSSRYNGGNFVLKIWGDNPFTEKVDGLLDGDYLRFKKYNSLTNSIEDIQFNFIYNFVPFFNPNNMYIASEVFENKLDNVNLFPNPSNDIIYITGLSSVKSLNLINSMGTKIKTITKKDFTDEFELNVKTLQSGSYILQINAKDDNQIIYKKFLVLEQN